MNFTETSRPVYVHYFLVLMLNLTLKSLPDLKKSKMRMRCIINSSASLLIFLSQRTYTYLHES